MKTLPKILFTFLMVACVTMAFCQDAPDSKTLVKQGVALHDAGKYDEAIAKYDEAIKLDPVNANAWYEKSFTMFTQGKGKDAVPYLEKVISLNPNIGGAFDLLGSIYDDDKQPDKAIDYYLQGIKVAPDYQRLYFNVAITYYRKGMFPESEKYAIDAIKLDPKHASSQRIYAMAAYKLNKRACSLFGWCSFLQLEPNTKRSIEAYRYVQDIFQSRVKIDSAVNGVTKAMTIYVQDNKGADSDEAALETSLSMTAATPTLDENKNKTPVELLNEELGKMFKIAGELSAKKKDKDFFWKYYADFFYQLAQSDNMPAFTRLVSLTAYRQENLQWFKDNDGKLKALESWVKDTKREF